MTRLILALAAAALLVAGCGGSGDDAEKQSGGGPVQITMWHGQNDIAGKVLGQLAEEPVHAVLLDISQGDLVDTRCAVVPAHRDPRSPQDVSAIDLVPKRVKPSSRIGLGRPVERMARALLMAVLKSFCQSRSPRCGIFFIGVIMPLPT